MTLELRQSELALRDYAICLNIHVSVPAKPENILKYLSTLEQVGQFPALDENWKLLLLHGLAQE